MGSGRFGIPLGVGLAVVLIVVGAILLRKLPVDSGRVPARTGAPGETLNGPDPGRTSRPASAGGASPPIEGQAANLPPAERVLQSALTRRREASARLRGVFVSRFTREADFALRDARLLGLLDPDACERFALELVAAGAKDADAAGFGVEILGILASQGRKSAEAALMAMASGPGNPLGTAATEALYGADRRGDYQSLYLKRAADGDPAAIRMLGTWADPQAAALLHDLVDRNRGLEAPASTIRLESEAALQRLQVIVSPDYDRLILRILAGEDRERQVWLTWALKMAEVRPPAGLTQVCRKRLDAAEARALRDEQLLLEERAQTPGAAQRQFLSASYAHYTHDHYFDDFLILYATSGGTLQEVERGRLDLFFETDPPGRRLERWLASREAAPR